MGYSDLPKLDPIKNAQRESLQQHMSIIMKLCKNVHINIWNIIHPSCSLINKLKYIELCWGTSHSRNGNQSPMIWTWKHEMLQLHKMSESNDCIVYVRVAAMVDEYIWNMAGIYK